QMRKTVRDIRTTAANAVAPAVIGQRRKLDVGPAAADALVCDAWEVCFARDARTEAAVERVIPDVQLVGIRCVAGGDEVDGIVRDVDDELVRADAVKRRYLESGQFPRLRLEAPAAVREPDHRALGFSPFAGSADPTTASRRSAACRDIPARADAGTRDARN